MPGCARRLGLPTHPPQVTEPFQVLADVEDDVRDALGVDTVGLLTARHLLRLSRTKAGSPGSSLMEQMFWFRTSLSCAEADNGDLCSMPMAIRRRRPARACPRAATTSTPSSARSRLDWDHLEPGVGRADVLGLYTGGCALHPGAGGRLYTNTTRSIVWTWGGGGFGDIAHVPGPRPAPSQGHSRPTGLDCRPQDQPGVYHRHL